MPNQSHTLRPNISVEDLKRQWSQKGREGKREGVIRPSELQEKEEEEDSAAGSMPGPVGMAGRQCGTSCTR